MYLFRFLHISFSRYHVSNGPPVQKKSNNHDKPDLLPYFPQLGVAVSNKYNRSSRALGSPIDKAQSNQSVVNQSAAIDKRLGPVFFRTFRLLQHT